MFAGNTTLDWIRSILALAACVAVAGCARPVATQAPFTLHAPEAMDLGASSPWPSAEAVPAARVSRTGEVRLPPGMGLPLVLTFQGEVPRAFVEATRRAVAVWNEGLGEEVVVIGPTGRGQVVHVAVDPGVKREGDGLVLGSARRSVPGDVWRIDLSPETPAALLEGTVVHELGHMLGLDHNASASSVMYQQATGLARPSLEDFAHARRGVEAYKLELDSLLKRWRAAIAD